MLVFVALIAAAAAADDAKFDARPYENWMRQNAIYAAARPWDPRAQTLFGMTGKAVAAVFRFDGLRLCSRAADAKAGMIMVHWDVDVAPASSAELIVDDRPDDTTFALRLRNLSIEQMEALFPKLVRDGGSIQFQRRASDSSAFYVKPAGMRQFDVTNSLVAVGNAMGDWYLQIRKDKGLLQAAYRGSTKDHRIPAFKDVARSWTEAQLLQELERAPGLNRPADLRSQAALDALAERNPADALWIEILRRASRSPDFARYRYDEILSALALADPSSVRTARFIETTVDALPEIEPRLPVPCADPMEQMAVRLLQRGVHWKRALDYIRVCSVSLETEQLVRALPLPMADSNERTMALRAIEERRRTQ